MIWLALACISDPGSYAYGVDLKDVEFVFYDLDMGVYPNNSLGQDPNNPFAETGISQDRKWEVVQAGPVPGFYAFGTALLSLPIGEVQFYTAQNAHGIFDLEAAPAEDLWAVREIAIAGYQAVLDNWPDDQLFSADGRYSFPVVDEAYAGMVALGVTPEGWIEVLNADGSTSVVAQ